MGMQDFRRPVSRELSMTHHDLTKERGEVLGLIAFFPRAIATSYTTAILCSPRDRFALDHPREQGE